MGTMAANGFPRRVTTTRSCRPMARMASPVWFFSSLALMVRTRRVPEVATFAMHKSYFAGPEIASRSARHSPALQGATAW